MSCFGGQILDRFGRKTLDSHVGTNEETKVHCVGDGAAWIANQIEEQFGSNATYLIDFYHLCEYLCAAAPFCSPGNEKIWLDGQKELIIGSQPVIQLL